MAIIKSEVTRLVNPSIILSLQSDRVTDSHVYINGVIFYNGVEWAAEMSVNRDEFTSNDYFSVHKMDSAFSFDRCLTERDKRQPNKDKKDDAYRAIRSYIDNNVDDLACKFKQFVEDCISMQESTQVVESLREQLKSAESKVETVDLNSIILKGVAESVIPTVKDMILQTCDEWTNRIPTRLEVKLGERVITTSESIRHEKFETVLNLVAAGQPVWLVGDAGTGKSVLCEQIAEAIGAEYRYSGAILDEFTGLKGFIDANGRKHGTMFTEALEIAASGDDVVFCMDECDGSTPEVLLVLNNLLSGGAVECMGKCYRMDDHLHIIACGNTNGRGGNTAYTRSIIDSATLDRFFLVDIDYSKRIDRVSARGDDELLSFIESLRDTTKKCGIDMLVSYRAISRIALMADKMDKAQLLDGALFRGIDRSDITTIEREMGSAGFTGSNNRWFGVLQSMV